MAEGRQAAEFSPLGAARPALTLRSLRVQTNVDLSHVRFNERDYSLSDMEETLDRYADGELVMLRACDILNEGWDSPATEVLLMARPTLSPVLDVQ